LKRWASEQGGEGLGEFSIVANEVAEEIAKTKEGS
jgi:hypothetical protein